MAQAPTTDESRERAVSSEPCSTRPNPFDDGDISSRKRRRTSLSGTSRSRSVETVNPSQGSHTEGDSAAEPQSDSAMKIDADSATPTTPEAQQLPTVQPLSGPRSSRVTINVRTPSRPLEAIPSSPTSPLPRGGPSPVDAVHNSVEEPDLDMSLDDAVVDTPVSSSSEGSSPPVEIVSVHPEDDVDGAYDQTEAGVTILGEMAHDQSGEFPYHDSSETYAETVSRLTQFIPTHDAVTGHIADWIETYLNYAKHADYHSIAESYERHREIWVLVPEFVMFMVGRKTPYPRQPALRESIFAFYRSFAKLTAHFLGMDFKALRNNAVTDQSHLPELASSFYAQALGMLTRKEEIALHASPSMSVGVPDWHFGPEANEILEIFQTYHLTPGGSLTYIKRIVAIEAELVPRFPKLTEHISHLSLLACNVLSMTQRRLPVIHHHHTHEQARSQIASGYAFFKAMEKWLTYIIDKHVNHLSYDAASSLLVTLTDIYQICLSTDGVVPDKIQEFRPKHPMIAPRNVPEAIAYHWKFTNFSKLIMSSQMQLRVMAVTAMCNDLVQFFRKFNNDNSESNSAFLTYIAEFLLQSGLVSYILGPGCHPEITTESGNIIGFLVVSATYTNAHTDTLWQTVTSAQDPRVSDALIRMTSRIANLFPSEALIYFCQKLNTIPVEAFGPTMRELCEQVFKQIITKAPFDRSITDSAPYDLCVRLIRQSSVLRQQAPVAYLDLHQFAVQKFKDILSHGPSDEGRQQIYLDCMDDISRKSPTTTGSLWVLLLMIRQCVTPELRSLTSKHDLTRKLVEELEAAISVARSAGFPAVLSGTQNLPRKELLGYTLVHEPATISHDLGPKLWHLLIGPGAASREDRDVAWQMLNSTFKRNGVGENPFIATCFSEYLPELGPDCFCTGTLEFVRERVLPLVNDINSSLLDDEETPDRAGIEQLWRMVLTAPEGTIEQQAIHMLVSDVYIDSRSIMSFLPHRARKVHLALVDRCLRQLSSAATRLKAFGDGANNGEDASMAIVATDQQVVEQELLFVRSLSVLREFHRLYQSKGHFSALDLGSLILDSPSEVDVEGELAELKYQSFDGDTQTEVKSLVIGKRNTAASLLASLREATGFTNYRIYYKGRPFVPHESDVCRSLEDLQIHSGIILVKRESDTPSSPTRFRAGASPVETEILEHFQELWGYLSMEEKLAQEIYSFLVKLPGDENVMKAIEDPSTPYSGIFPSGQPFKSLYAVHAVREYLASQRRKAPDGQLDVSADKADDMSSSPYPGHVQRAMALIVSAICDEEVIEQCPSQFWRIELSSSLVECLLSLLKDPFLPASAARFLDSILLDRLLGIMTSALSANTLESATKHIPVCLQSILESCSASQAFISAFCTHDLVPGVLETALLYDTRVEVRQSTALFILGKISGSSLGSCNVDATDQFRAFFWPLVSGLLKPAVTNAGNSTEVLELCLETFKILRDARSPILDVQRHLDEWCNLLLHYTTFEDVTQPDIIDPVANLLIRLLHAVLCGEESPARREITPPTGVARKIFWKHLFPPLDKEERPEYIQPVLHPRSRIMLIEIIFSLIKDDPTQTVWLLEDLNDLVPVFPDDDGDLYVYELCPGFERAKAIRASCGYVGLKNLSNTCYLNSLFTQLFMNTNFRRFILSAEVRDRNFSQALLFYTQKLFGVMQGSIRRFISPEDCVNNIKTYEETQIDIHNQMDVDEFYNLLFDRWEAQFLKGEEKRQFRSFFGGQLVQQVASKECEHISERLEPFSAIQCDIKGKSSLQESLQAYVDGEIMEGDNKYKCSTCDRHVDAVKRACLKDIPDNLIFHLKRFDFNLRTLQRSKINDHFSFPTEIDMRPYTIEHLSDSMASSKPEDIFELVGILVHSGTAESGHYYSFVRERPSSSETPVWVEFNDDVVSSWDPANMENACFGGPDFRSHFENNNVIYDKTYSAYMLFYQRSTSLAKERELLRKSNLTSPLRVELSQELAEFIQEENLTLLRRHCLYDPSQIQFVNTALIHVKRINHQECTPDHATENLALAMALSHLDQVASRAKDVPDFFGLLKRISSWCQSCVRCCLAVYHYFSQYPECLRLMVQKNPDPEVRQAMVGLFISVLEVIKQQLPLQYGLPPADSGEESDDEDFDSRNTVMAGTVEILKLFWENFHSHLRSWAEVFDFMRSFVRMGRHEMAEFLEQPFLRFLLLMIWADPTLELPPQFVRMMTNVTRRPTNRPPSYEAVIGLIDLLTAKMKLVYNEFGDIAGPDTPEQRFECNTDTEQQYLFTKQEAKIIHTEWGRAQGNIFVDKLISINQNPLSTHSIIENLIRQGRVMEERVCRTLRIAISGQATQHSIAPYLRVASQVFCRVARQQELVISLIAHVSQQCSGLQSVEGMAFLDFQRDVFNTPQEGSGFSRQQILAMSYDRIPVWAPGLLGYFETAVVTDTEAFLGEVLFKHSTSLTLADSGEDSNVPIGKIIDTARRLGLRCLIYLRDNYVVRREGVATRLVAGLERVIRECGKFYNLKDSSEDEGAKEFLQLRNSVLESLRKLTVEELEEDGSDWENSSVCSEQLDSLGDVSMPMAGEGVVDLQ